MNKIKLKKNIHLSTLSTDLPSSLSPVLSLSCPVTPKHHRFPALQPREATGLFLSFPS